MPSYLFPCLAGILATPCYSLSPSWGFLPATCRRTGLTSNKPEQTQSTGHSREGSKLQLPSCPTSASLLPHHHPLQASADGGEALSFFICRPGGRDLDSVGRTRRERSAGWRPRFSAEFCLRVRASLEPKRGDFVSGTAKGWSSACSLPPPRASWR